jgi:type IV fimbrial biogenesis protein FimT
MPAHPAASSRPGSVLVRRARAAGFTLLELIVTVAIISIIAAIAYPSMTELVNANRLAGGANEMVASLQLARMEAVRLNTTVTVCRSTDGATCSVGGTWNSWIIIADADRDGAVDDVLRTSSVNAPLQVMTSAAIVGSKVAFKSDGMARASDGSLLKANIAVCMPTAKPALNERWITIATGSRVSSRPENGAGQCDAPDNPN